MEEKDIKKQTALPIIVGVIVFLFFASGIPLALRDQSTVRFFGEFPIFIFGILISFVFARGAFKMMKNS